MTINHINDNSCDCPDGSDEPGTAACANLDPLSPEQPLANSPTGTTNTTHALPGFWCANEGHIGSYVPFMYVNDGVCDYELCCDGTEEYRGVGGVKCPNKCAEIGKEWRHTQQEKQARLEKAMKKRNTMAKEAREIKRTLEKKISTLKADINLLETNKADLQQKYEQVKQSEQGKVGTTAGGMTGKLGLLAGTAKARVEELRSALHDSVQQKKLMQEKVSELEGILSKFKEEYNPNFNDEGVKSAVKSWEDYAARKDFDDSLLAVNEDDLVEIMKEDGKNSGVNWADFADDGSSETDIREFVSGCT